MKQSEKLEELLKLMQANPELPVIPCVDGDVVGGDDCYCWLGTWGASGIQEYIIGNERTYYREDDISEMNDLLYERYDPELVDNMTEEETRRQPSGSSTRGGRKLSGSISTARFSPESCEPSLW